MRISDFSGALERIKIKLLFCTTTDVSRNRDVGPQNRFLVSDHDMKQNKTNNSVNKAVWGANSPQNTSV